MKEEVLIEVKVEEDNGDFQKLSQLKTALMNIKQEQKDLADAFKKGTITQKEYSDQVVRLEANQKKLAASYNETQKKITGLKSPFDNLAQAVKEQAKQVNIAGVSYTAFLNPITATVAGLGALYKLYASSTQGAKDLDYAQNVLSATTNILGNEFAKLIGSTGKDGDGFFSTLARGAIGYFSPALAAISNQVAMLKEDLEDLGRELLNVQGDNNERLAENAELLQKVQDSQVKYADKISLTSQAIANLRKNEEELLRVKNEELKKLEQLLGWDKENEDLQSQVLQKEKEISRVKSDTERKVNNILKLESNLKDAEDKRLQTLREQNSEIERQARISKLERSLKKDTSGLSGAVFSDEELNAQNIARTKNGIDSITESQKNLGEEVDNVKKKQKTADDQFIKSNEAKAQLLQKIMSDISSSFKIQLTSIEDFSKSVLKGFLTAALRTFKDYIEFKILGESLSTPDSVLSFGASGVIRSGLLIGLVEAAFGAAEAGINGFAQGGLVQGGTPIKRSNGDDTLITAKRGEVVLTQGQQMALGGPLAMRLAGVPGFATGGLVGPGLSSSMVNAGMTHNIIAALKQQRFVVVVEQVTALQQQQAKIIERARLT